MEYEHWSGFESEEKAVPKTVAESGDELTGCRKLERFTLRRHDARRDLIRGESDDCGEPCEVGLVEGQQVLHTVPLHCSHKTRVVSEFSLNTMCDDQVKPS